MFNLPHAGPSARIKNEHVGKAFNIGKHVLRSGRSSQLSMNVDERDHISK